MFFHSDSSNTCQMTGSPVIVVNTWPIPGAADAAWHVLTNQSQDLEPFSYPNALNAVVAGCTAAEEDRNVKTVGYGCCPDEEGHTTLDAMVMDGRTMEVSDHIRWKWIPVLS